jgi:hypothetical protein
MFAPICGLFPPVGDLVALVGDPFPLVRHLLAVVRRLLALVQRPRARRHRRWLHTSRFTLGAQPHVLTIQVCTIGLQSPRPARNLGGEALDLATSSLIAPPWRIGAQPRQIQAIHLQLRGGTLDGGTTLLKVAPLTVTLRIPPRSRGSMARGAPLVHTHRPG